ncbi:hypothetical protein [Streptomyces roseoverticillatus]|uniref:Tc1-like transposase DDE domain-containing protein n=1 Tax=Streptomyces roseoverticillatus TaxID=66429 RepID=A0ABV3IZK4_9ACTN
MLDNASTHAAKAFTGRHEQPAGTRVELFHLPSRNPEPNDIEPARRQAKYHGHPQRARTSTDAIGEAGRQPARWARRPPPCDPDREWPP